MDLEKLALQAGMVSLLKQGAASCVHTEGCNGVAEDQLQRFAELVQAAERDCRTCANWTPHHRADVMHCSAAIRCVVGSSYKRQGRVQLWEAAPNVAGNRLAEGKSELTGLLDGPTRSEKD